MPSTKPPYPAEFREQIVELVHAGRSPAELASLARLPCATRKRISWGC